MTTYYNILETIKNQLLQDPMCNSVTEGSIWEIDLSKQTIAPYAHIQVNNASIKEFTNVFNISVFCMDIVDKTTDLTTDKFRGGDNEQDVLNTQYAVGTRLLEMMRRGDLRDNNFALVDGSQPTLESFTERFENFWAGWTITFDVEVPNEMTICNAVPISGDCANANYIITDTSGNTLYSGTIASGGSISQQISDSSISNSDDSYTADIVSQGSLELPDVTFTVNNTLGTQVQSATIPSVTDKTLVAPDGSAVVEYLDGTAISTNAVASGASRTIQVPNPIVCADATVHNTDDSFTTTVASGADLELADINTTINDSQGTIIGVSTSVSNTDVTLVAPDASYTVEYVNGTSIETGTIVSNGSKTIQVTNPIVCADATVSNSDDSFSTTVASGGDLELSDSTLNLNSVDKGDFVSVKTLDVNIVDEDSVAIEPTTATLNNNVLSLAIRNPEKLFMDMYEGKAVSHGGALEASSCVDLSDLFDASPVAKIQPSAYGVGKLIAVKPLDGGFDLDVERNTTATRVNSSGLIETVAANVPRLDYKNSTCPVILVEPQSTNLVVNSTDISDASYTILRASVIDNGIDTPIDGQLAQKVVATSVSGNHFLRASVSNPTASTYTVTAYMKKAGCNVALRVAGASFSNRIEWQIDLSDGSDINFVQAGTFSATTSVESLDDDWLRVEAVITLSSSDTKLESSFFVLNPANNNVGGWTGDDVSGFYLAGYQIENRSGATSYIPTSGTTVTRNEDEITITGLTGTSTITETFEDDSTNVITNPTTYTMSQGRIKKVIKV